MIFLVAYYLMANFAALTIHSVSPTNMAGPGVDLLVYLLALVFSIVFLTKSIIKAKSRIKGAYQTLIVNIVGTMAILVLLYLAVNTNVLSLSLA